MFNEGYGYFHSSLDISTHALQLGCLLIRIIPWVHCMQGRDPIGSLLIGYQMILYRHSLDISKRAFRLPPY